MAPNSSPAGRADQIPTTGRGAARLSRYYGFRSVEDLAHDIPGHGIVIDVGAGLSRLGHEVAHLRPDITWLNVDPAYKHRHILSTAIRQAPENVQFLDLDITQPSQLQRLHHAADVVYCYWLLPHLSLESDAVASHAVTTMYGLLKSDGRLIIGPVRRPGLGLFSPIRYKGAATYTRMQKPAVVIYDAVARTKLWWLPALVQRFSNHYRIHIGALLIGGKLKRSSRR